MKSLWMILIEYMLGEKVQNEKHNKWVKNMYDKLRKAKAVKENK